MHQKSLKSQTQTTRIKLLIFLLKFLVLSLPIIVLFKTECYPLEKLTAEASSIIIRLAGVNNTVFDTLNPYGTISPAVYLPNGLILRIDFACTGIRSVYLLFALLFSFPVKLKKQLKYLLIGLVLIFLVNVIRISSAAIIARIFGISSVFDNVVWSVSLNVTVLIIVLFYIKQVYSLNA